MRISLLDYIPDKNALLYARRHVDRKIVPLAEGSESTLDEPLGVFEIRVIPDGTDIKEILR